MSRNAVFRTACGSKLRSAAAETAAMGNASGDLQTSIHTMDGFMVLINYFHINLIRFTARCKEFSSSQAKLSSLEFDYENWNVKFAELPI